MNANELKPPQPDDLLGRLRLAELERAREVLPQGARVLEIGGGNGFQAAWLRHWGYDVVSIDIGSEWSERFFPVQPYDGVTIPAADQSFDVVFSSNVLEHVEALGKLLAETARVLKPSGLAVHIVPTPAWRIWTSVIHYPWLIRYLLYGRREGHGRGVAAPRDVLARRGLWGGLRRALFSPPHGVDTSALVEAFSFSTQRWLREFHSAGFRCEAHRAVGLFYAGYVLLPNLTVAARERLAAVLGSATRLYLLRPSSKPPHGG